MKEQDMPLGGKKERRDLERISFDKYIKCQSCILIIRFRDPLFFLLQALLLKCQNKLKVKQVYIHRKWLMGESGEEGEREEEGEEEGVTQTT